MEYDLGQVSDTLLACNSVLTECDSKYSKFVEATGKYCNHSKTAFLDKNYSYDALKPWKKAKKKL